MGTSFRNDALEIVQVLESCTTGMENKPCSAVASVVFDQMYGRCFLIEETKEKQVAAGMGISVIVNLHRDDVWPDFPPTFDGVRVMFTTYKC